MEAVVSGRVIVLGAGLAGLSAAHHLGDCEVYEEQPYAGGHCRTKELHGFHFDEGAHVFFGTDDCSQEFILRPLGDELVEHRAEIWNCYGEAHFGRYPVQVNANALGPDIATRCVEDFVAAAAAPDPQVRNYEDWCRACFGDTLAERFLLRYARKVWTVEPSELTLDWINSSVGGRIARPPLREVLRGAIDPSPQELNYLTRFKYPRKGGFARVVEPLATLAPNVRLGNGVSAIDLRTRQIRLADGSTREFDVAVSTLPLPRLLAITSPVPDAVRAAGDRLMWTSVRCVNIGIERADVGPGHWVYFYDEHVPFFRVSFPSKLASGNAPPGCSSISCEIAYSRRRPLDERNLESRVLDGLRQAAILGPAERIVLVDQIDIPYAYVLFDHHRVAVLHVIHEWMAGEGLLPCGRFGEWGYHWSFEAIESGRRVAAEARRLAAGAHR